MYMTLEVELINTDHTRETIVLYGIRSETDGEQISSQLREYGYPKGTLYRVRKRLD